MKQLLIYAAALLVCISLQHNVFAETARTLTWDQCVSEAMQKNPTLKASREKVIQKESDTGITRSSMLPQVSATASAAKLRSESSGSDPQNSYSYGLSGKQLLFDGFKSVYDLKSSKADEEASRVDYKVSSALIRYNLRNAFIDLIKAQEMVKITSEIEMRRKHIFDLVKMRYEAGREHKGSYFTTKADYSQAQADAKSAERDLSTAQVNLLTIMGSEEKIIATGDLSVSIEDKYVKTPDFISLAAKNPSVVKTTLARNAAMYSAKSAKLDYSPKIYGTASVGKSGQTATDTNTNWSVGVEATAPLFEGGQTYYTEKKASAAYRQAEADEAAARNSAIASLESSWSTLKTELESVGVQKDYLEAANERSRIGEAQYSIGLLTFDNWTIIETNLVSAKKKYIEACASVFTAEAAWIQSIEGTLENETQK